MSPEPGDVLNYSYLWEHEYQHGRDEGVKDRPVAVVVVVKSADGLNQVLVVPLTTREPVSPADAIEVPASVRRHLGLSAERSWIIVSEWNRFTWPGYDIRPIRGREPDVKYGGLPTKLFEQIKRTMIARGIGRPVNRDE